MPKPASGVAHMTLRINEVNYVVMPLGVKNGCRFFRLRKKENEKIVEQYNVWETPQGTRCDCPDFLTRRIGYDPDGCKHIKSMRVFYMVL